MIMTSPDPASLLDMFATYDPPHVDKWIEKKKGL